MSVQVSYKKQIMFVLQRRCKPMRLIAMVQLAPLPSKYTQRLQIRMAGANPALEYEGVE